jgi:hypothetical protein
MSKINLKNFDLNQLPKQEDDTFEFKSSSTNHAELKEKLVKATSGFANSGGGYFIIGIDGETGNADGGYPTKINKQDIRDWIDNVIHNVEPCPSYEIELIQDPNGRGNIDPDCAVILVYIYESYVGPHMAPDKRYYIRAGAHTVSAKHFIVEAIWAKRNFSKPQLTHLFRLKPNKEQIIQLGVLALTNAPAVEVKITISPLPNLMNHCESYFPLNCSVLDQNNPFFFDVTTYLNAKENFGQDVYIEIHYCDLCGNPYTYKAKLELIGTVPPITIGNDNLEKTVKALESINKSLLQLIEPRKENIVKPSFILPRSSESVFLDLERLIPELLGEMKNDLREFPFAREFIILYKDATYNGDPNNCVLAYYFEDHNWLRSKLRILENYALIYEITFNNATRFIISEDFASYLMNNI